MTVGRFFGNFTVATGLLLGAANSLLAQRYRAVPDPAPISEQDVRDLVQQGLDNHNIFWSPTFWAILALVLAILALLWLLIRKNSEPEVVYGGESGDKKPGPSGSGKHSDEGGKSKPGGNGERMLTAAAHEEDLRRARDVRKKQEDVIPPPPPSVRDRRQTLIEETPVFVPYKWEKDPAPKPPVEVRNPRLVRDLDAKYGKPEEGAARVQTITSAPTVEKVEPQAPPPPPASTAAVVTTAKVEEVEHTEVVTEKAPVVDAGPEKAETKDAVPDQNSEAASAEIKAVETTVETAVVKTEETVTSPTPAPVEEASITPEAGPSKEVPAEGEVVVIEKQDERKQASTTVVPAAGKTLMIVFACLSLGWSAPIVTSCGDSSGPAILAADGVVQRYNCQGTDLGGVSTGTPLRFSAPKITGRVVSATPTGITIEVKADATAALPQEPDMFLGGRNVGHPILVVTRGDAGSYDFLLRESRKQFPTSLSDPAARKAAADAAADAKKALGEGRGLRIKVNDLEAKVRDLEVKLAALPAPATMPTDDHIRGLAKDEASTAVAGLKTDVQRLEQSQQTTATDIRALKTEVATVKKDAEAGKALFEPVANAVLRDSGGILGSGPHKADKCKIARALSRPNDVLKFCGK